MLRAPPSPPPLTPFQLLCQACDIASAELAPPPHYAVPIPQHHQHSSSSTSSLRPLPPSAAPSHITLSTRTTSRSLSSSPSLPHSSSLPIPALCPISLPPLISTHTVFAIPKPPSISIPKCSTPKCSTPKCSTPPRSTITHSRPYVDTPRLLPQPTPLPITPPLPSARPMLPLSIISQSPALPSISHPDNRSSMSHPKLFSLPPFALTIPAPAKHPTRSSSPVILVASPVVRPRPSHAPLPSAIIPLTLPPVRPASVSPPFPSEQTAAHRPRASRGRPFVCSVSSCSKTFARVYNLKAHQRVHSRERPYGCARCNRRFRWRSSLTSHAKHHRKTDAQSPTDDLNQDDDIDLASSHEPHPMHNPAQTTVS